MRHPAQPPLWRAAAAVVCAAWAAHLAAAPADARECGADLPAHRLVARAQGAAAPAVAFVPDPAPLTVGRHFRLRGEVCGPVRLLRVDADMPAHRHGMNYRPTLGVDGAGRFEAAGLLLHMPGRWRLRFEVEPAGQPGAGARQWLDVEVELR